jgi:hypothetical protein
MLKDSNGIIEGLKANLAKFGIHHTTVQIECGNCGQGRVADH